MNVDTADLESLGSYIRRRRQSLGLTQTQLGQRLGWMQERVSILENGKYGMPSLPALARLAIACEVPLMEILRAAGYGDESHVETDSLSAEQPNGQALLYTLQQLLAIDVGTMHEALNQAADLVAGVMGAEKVDALIYEPDTKSLVAVGASKTEMGRRQHELGMDRLPLANRGREAEVFETGTPYLTGDAASDPHMLIGMTDGLHIASFLGVPLSVNGTRRGVLIATSSQRDQFHEEDIPFLQTVARWVGMTAHHAELMELVQRDAVEKARRTGAEELIEYVGHDTKLHLEPVMQRLATLKNTVVQNGHAEYVSDIDFVREAVGRVERSIEELLDASALERGLVPLAYENTDIIGLVGEIADRYRDGPAPIHVRAPETLYARVDASRVKRAVDALVRNALRRSPSRLPVVIAVDREQRNGTVYVSLSVQDEGTNVGDTIRPRMPAGVEGHDLFPALGLSLFQARSTAEAHGGTVSVDMTNVNSAIYTLSIPVER